MDYSSVCSCTFMPHPQIQEEFPNYLKAYSALGASPPLSALSHFEDQATQSPRRAQSQLQVSFPLEMPSPSHLVPKSPLHADRHFISENQEAFPCDVHSVFPTSAHLWNNLVCLTEPKRLSTTQCSTQRHIDEGFQALELHGKESLRVPLSGETPESGERSGSRLSPHHPLRTPNIRKLRFRKRAWPWLCCTQH